MILIIIGAVLVVSGFAIYCKNIRGIKDTDLDGILMVSGIVLVFIGMLVMIGKEYRQEEEVEQPTITHSTVAGAIEGLQPVIGTDYHYQYPQVELEDVDLLARLITAEQGYGANEDAYFYTASVVWNRMKSDSFPDELREVIYQHTGEHYQYQCVKDGHIERDYDDVAWEVAVAVLENGTWIPDNVVYQAEFEQGHGVWQQVGRTYFCYE